AARHPRRRLRHRRERARHRKPVAPLRHRGVRPRAGRPPDGRDLAGIRGRSGRQRARGRIGTLTALYRLRRRRERRPRMLDIRRGCLRARRPARISITPGEALMFHLAWPWMALLLPLPWILLRTRRAAEPGGAALYLPFAASVAAPSATATLPRGVLALLGAIWALLILAAMRP